MLTIETIEIDGILREVEVDWDLYKGRNDKRTKNAFVDLIYRLNVKGYKLLSEYANTKTKVLIDFNCGHEPHWISPEKFKQNRGCPRCAIENNALRNINRTKEDFYKLCENKDYKILSKYVNSETKVLIDFNCGHEPHWITPNGIKSGKGCPKCGIENRNLSKTHKAKEDFYKLCKEKGYKLLSEYANTKTKVLIDFNCGHEPNWITPINLKQGRGCPKCAIENRSGENNCNWKGGITPLTNYLREKINQWKKDSFKLSNYRCVITGVKGSNVVHHLMGFNTILFETMETLNLPIYQMINEYTEEELKLIEEKCLELHYKYGLGVVLCPEIHEEFHSIYGRGNNTPEQFEEFKQMKLNHKEECA